MTEPITMNAGDTRRIEVTVTRLVDGVSTVVDLTGASVRWALGRYRDDPNPLVVKSSATGGITINEPPTAGKFTVLLDPVDTDAITAGRYYQEAEVTEANGVVSTPVRGILRLQPTMLRVP